MKKLSRTAQTQIDSFMKGHARPLERQLYLYHFHGDSLANVLAEFARMQDPDGSFGRRLEPGMRLPASSIKATSRAFQYFRAFRIPADLPVVVNACRYLS